MRTQTTSNAFSMVSILLVVCFLELNTIVYSQSTGGGLTFNCESQSCPSCSDTEDLAHHIDYWYSDYQVEDTFLRVEPCDPPTDSNGNPNVSIKQIELRTNFTISYTAWIRYCHPKPDVPCPACDSWPKTQCGNASDPTQAWWEVIISEIPCTPTWDMSEPVLV